MSLVDLWTSSQEQIVSKHLSQIISFAGGTDPRIAPCMGYSGNTRLDEIVDLIFSTAEDLKVEDEPITPGETTTIEEPLPDKKFTPVAFHRACVDRIEHHLSRTFLKRSRADQGR